MFKITALLLVIAYFSTVQGQKHLPLYFPHCYRDDLKLNDCLVKATKLVKPYLQKGIPELNIAPISPYFMPEVNLEQGTGSLNYQSAIKNLIIYGLDTYEFISFEFDPKLLKFRGAVKMGSMSFVGDFSFKGKIFSLALESKGKIYSNVTSSNGTLIQDAKLVTKKGITYLVTLKPQIKINIGNMDYNMDDLFENNAELGKLAKTVVKYNIKELVQDVTPAIEKVIEEIIQDLLLKSTAKVPYDELFPIGFKTELK